MQIFAKLLSNSFGGGYLSHIHEYPLIHSGASQVVLVVKNLPASVGDLRDMGLISGLGRSPGGGHSNPLQYSCLGNPMDRGAWQATVYRMAPNLGHD